MLRRKSGIILLALFFVLSNAFFVTSSRPIVTTVAPSTVSHNYSTLYMPYIYKRSFLPAALTRCSYASSPSLIIAYNNWRNTVYFCGVGYLAHRINNVNEVYNNAGGTAWVKWYRGPQGHYCSVNGLGGYQDFNPPVRITQIDYGDERPSDSCGS